MGTLYEEDSYLSFRSSSPFSLEVLEPDWKDNLTKVKCIKLVKAVISNQKERDVVF